MLYLKILINLHVGEYFIFLLDIWWCN